MVAAQMAVLQTALPVGLLQSVTVYPASYGYVDYPGAGMPYRGDRWRPLTVRALESLPRRAVSGWDDHVPWPSASLRLPEAHVMRGISDGLLTRRLQASLPSGCIVRLGIRNKAHATCDVVYVP